MKTTFLAIISFLVLPLSLSAQDGLSVLEIMNDGRPRYEAERLVIVQDPALDMLVSRHILYNARKDGVDGWRIQIYRGGHRTASDDANKVRARFMDDYPDIRYIPYIRQTQLVQGEGRRLPHQGGGCHRLLRHTEKISRSLPY